MVCFGVCISVCPVKKKKQKRKKRLVDLKNAAAANTLNIRINVVTQKSFFVSQSFLFLNSSSASGFRVKNGLLNGHSPPRFSRVPFGFSSSTDRVKLSDP